MRLVVVAAPAVPRALADRTLAWARSLDPEPAVVDGEEAARAAIPGPGPVVVVWADTPRLGPVHAYGVQADLDSGSGVVVGPTLDGGVYLVATRSPRPELIGPGFPQVLELASAAGLEVGMLRHERRLTRPEDRDALLADPLIDEPLRAAIRLG
jgi:2-phospho-L-lactate guanylyltransferase (CobY/MobA/RfbA family)